MVEYESPLLRAWLPTCREETKALVSQHDALKDAKATPAMVLLYLAAEITFPGDCASLAIAINDEIALLDKVREIVAGPLPYFGVSQDTATVMALHTVLGVDRG